jgi:hypothetical protein
MKRRDYYIMEEGMEEGKFIDRYSNLVLKKKGYLKIPLCKMQPSLVVC